MKKFFLILCCTGILFSLSSCAIFQPNKCNRCPKFNQVEPAIDVDATASIEAEAVENH